MRIDTIDELYYGNIRPTEKQYRRDSEYGQWSAEASRLATLIHQMLGSDGKKVEDELETIRAKMSYEIERYYFSEGFKLGARIVLAVLDDTDGDFKDIE